MATFATSRARAFFSLSMEILLNPLFTKVTPSTWSFVKETFTFSSW